METVLITGGAGFIGSHLADAYLQAGYRVRILDNLEPQVHGGLREAGGRPDYLAAEAELVVGDVRDREALARALDGVTVVSHHAALVGVGQSMYDIERYTSVNSVGTAVLLDVIVNQRLPIRRLVVASSMSVYGEGTYRRPASAADRFPDLRPRGQLEARQWEVFEDGEPLAPVPTREDRPLKPASVYAIGKRDQEELALVVGLGYGIPTIAFRYFNVFGSRQALSNPYTGVAAIFAGRLLNGKAPMVYEDGEQRRDFVHVADVAAANIRAAEAGADVTGVMNVGSGQSVTVSEIATTVAEGLGVSIQPSVTNKFRFGDVRHCYADITRARTRLGWEPKHTLRSGAPELVDWVARQTAVDRFDQMTRELESRGLSR
jgi:dTDP-L-rhamnose 4-epimerase